MGDQFLSVFFPFRCTTSLDLPHPSSISLHLSLHLSAMCAIASTLYLPTQWRDQCYWECLRNCLHLCRLYVQILRYTKGLCMGFRKEIYSVTKYIIKMFPPYESKGRKGFWVLFCNSFLFVDVSWLFFFCETTRLKWIGALRGSERTRDCPLSLSVSVNGVSWGWPSLCPLSFTSRKGAALYNAAHFE